MSILHLPKQALSDASDILDHDLQDVGPTIASRFLAALERAICQIREEPGIASPRLAQVLQNPLLRIRPIKGFPYLIFYLNRAEGVEIWRILHTARDIPAFLRE